jgi:lipopolysaccharide assembly protein A
MAGITGEKKTKYKLIVAVILALLAMIVILQNTIDITTRILFFTVTMPLWILLLGTILVGFALGVIITLLAVREKRRKEPQ